jgi:hypothetical protein
VRDHIGHRSWSDVARLHADTGFTADVTPERAIAESH